jgi:hypothetical protein
MQPIRLVLKKGNARDRGDLENRSDCATWIRAFDPAQKWSRNSRAVRHLLRTHFAVDSAGTNHLGQQFEGFKVLSGINAMCWLCHRVFRDINIPLL